MQELNNYKIIHPSIKVHNNNIINLKHIMMQDLFKDIIKNNMVMNMIIQKIKQQLVHLLEVKKLIG